MTTLIAVVAIIAVFASVAAIVEIADRYAKPRIDLNNLPPNITTTTYTRTSFGGVPQARIDWTCTPCHARFTEDLQAGHVNLRTGAGKHTQTGNTPKRAVRRAKRDAAHSIWDHQNRHHQPDWIKHDLP